MPYIQPNFHPPHNVISPLGILRKLTIFAMRNKLWGILCVIWRKAEIKHRRKKNRCASFGAKRKLNTEEKKIGVCHLAPSGNKHGRKKTKKISALHTTEFEAFNWCNELIHVIKIMWVGQLAFTRWSLFMFAKKNKIMRCSIFSHNFRTIPAGSGMEDIFPQFSENSGGKLFWGYFPTIFVKFRREVVLRIFSPILISRQFIYVCRICTRIFHIQIWLGNTLLLLTLSP